MDINYSYYTNFVNTVVRSNDLSNFKSHPSYTGILEHVNEAQGHEYLRAIQNNTSISNEMLKAYCSINDARGNPKKINFGFMEASPTSLRYAWHAHLILSYCVTLKQPRYNIVEIGGGYGGLCFALYYFSSLLYKVSIQSYTIIDLEEPLRLQELYLKDYPLSFPIDYIDALTYGKNISKDDLFLISNYCFSEIRLDYQRQYIANLFPKVSHGFMVWNMIPLYDFGFHVKVADEVPNTGVHNKFVYF